MFERLHAKIIRDIEEQMNHSLEMLKERVDDYTPEDTYNLISSTKIQKARQKGGAISGCVYNTSKYAKYVEYGHTGKVFNYYKGRGRRLGWLPFYSGTGARMFGRTKKELFEQVVADFKKLFT